MHRILAIFLLMLLPLQSSWAATGAYCSHDSAEALHWGHHGCKSHQTPNDASATDGSKTSHALLGDHADCHICHVASSAVFAVHARFEPITTGETYGGSMRACLTSTVSNRPERPQWRSLA